tara:strand:- start:8335 stop:8706 length:372 start_codon:yes stop_codon:yes gene_type:complete
MLQNILTSPIFNGALSLITNFGLQYLTQDLQQFVQEIFKYTIARKLVLFAMLFSATRSFKISIIMTFIIIAFSYLSTIKNKIKTFKNKIKFKKVRKHKKLNTINICGDYHPIIKSVSESLLSK